jgi:hypothetical protein
MDLVNPTIPARVHARSRNDSRLQSMTLGAAAMGIAATGFFGYAAALTYAGTTSAAAQQGGVSGQLPYGNSGYAGQSSQGGAVNPYYNQQQIIPPTTSRHSSHASSGGS